MSKIALITDTHAGVRNDNPAFQHYQKKCYEWFLDYVLTNDICHVIHLGDIYDKRKHVNFMSAKRLREDFLEPLERNNIATHILAGNHDMYYKNDHQVNALREIVGDRYQYINIYDTPTVINVDGLDIQLMPWITDSNYDEALEELIKTPKAPILMGHLELSGFKMYRGVISSHGLDRKLFENFDAVYSGHYHHRSSVGNVTYLGAFGEYTWQDLRNLRGFSVLDTETRKVEFIENPHHMFRIVKYDDLDNQDIIEKIQKSDFSKHKDSYVKIVVINKTNPYAFDLFFDAIYKAGPIDIQIVEDPTVLVDNNEEETINEAEDTTTILRSYIDGLTLPLDKDKMKGFMVEVYQEALQVETV